MPIRSIDPVGHPIYDKRGMPLAYIGDDNVLYRLDGSPVGYVHRENVWTFPGEPVAWFTDGWLRTLPGYCAGFVGHATPHLGPSKPIRKRAPLRQLKRSLRPVGIRKKYPQRPGLKRQWSKASLALLLDWIQLDAGQ